MRAYARPLVTYILLRGLHLPDGDGTVHVNPFTLHVMQEFPSSPRSHLRFLFPYNSQALSTLSTIVSPHQYGRYGLTTALESR